MKDNITLSIKDICLIKTNAKSINEIVDFTTIELFEEEKQKCSDNPKYIHDSIVSALDDIKENWGSWRKMKVDNDDFDEVKEFVEYYNNFGKEGMKIARDCKKIPWKQTKFKQFVYDMDALSESDKEELKKYINPVYRKTGDDAKYYKLAEDYIKFLNESVDVDRIAVSRTKKDIKKRTQSFVKLHTNLGRLKQRHSF